MEEEQLECILITGKKETGMTMLKPQKQLLQFVMLSLLSVVSVLVMANESYAAMDCGSCHGNGINPATGQLITSTDMRPVDSTFRNITTGGFAGSHQSHMKAAVAPNATAAVTACAACHSNTGAYSTGHRSGTITFAAVGYNKGAGVITFTNATSVPVLGTCGTASCHVSPVSTAYVVTPYWGTNTAAGCAGCHTGANLITASGPATGSHALAGHVTACIDCHAAGTTATVAPTTGHLDGNIDVANVGYATLNKTKGLGAGTTCSAASCHASPVAATTVVTPAWGTVGAGCAACHSGANLITASGPVTGNHAIPGHVTACTDCHAAGTSATVAPTAGHADGNIDVANVGYATLNKAKGSAGVTCSAATCHVSPIATTLIVTPAWGTTGNGCVACHTGGNLITATGPATGSHALAGHAAACTACHAAGTTATIAPTTGHLDGNIDVANVGYATLNKTKGLGAGATCSAASCHVSPVNATLIVTTAWGTTGAGCVVCHAGGNAITATGPATGSHALAGHAAACTACHAAGTTATVAPTTGHIDGNIDVANVGYATLNKTKGLGAGTTCSAASCHVSPVNATLVVTPAWGATGAGCAACHTGANLITATGPNTYGHNLHMLRTTAPMAIACIDCHAPGTTATTAPTLANGHTDGNIDITIGGYALNKTKGSAATGTCSNIACHNSPVGYTPSFTANTATWGSNLSCNGCHGYPPAGPNHAGVAAGTCNSCHSNVKPGNVLASTNTIFVNNALHMNEKVDEGRCDTCHGYPPVRSMVGRGTNLLGYSSAKMQNYSGGGGVHDVAGHLPTTLKYSNGGGFAACLACHPSTLHNQANASFGGFSTSLVQVVVDPKYKFDKNRAIVYNAKQSGPGLKTTGTCANVECHYQKSPVWSSEAYTQRH